MKTSPYGHVTSKKTSPLQSPWLSPKLYSTVQITPCNKVTSPIRSLLPSPVGDLNSEVPLYINIVFGRSTHFFISCYNNSVSKHYICSILVRLIIISMSYHLHPPPREIIILSMSGSASMFNDTFMACRTIFNVLIIKSRIFITRMPRRTHSDQL